MWSCWPLYTVPRTVCKSAVISPLYGRWVDTRSTQQHAWYVWRVEAWLLSGGWHCLVVGYVIKKLVTTHTREHSSTIAGGEPKSSPALAPPRAVPGETASGWAQGDVHPTSEWDKLGLEGELLKVWDILSIHVREENLKFAQDLPWELKGWVGVICRVQSKGGEKKGIKGGPGQSRPAARETVDSGNQLKPQGVCVHVCLRIRHAVLDGALASGEMQRWLTPTLVALI